MDTDDKNLRLVRTILTLAEIVGVRAEAEGISTSEQLRELRALNCEQGQGYLFSAPITKEAVMQLGLFTVAPVTPLLLTIMPLDRLLRTLLGVLF